jgi:two-component system, sensor histidine kinase
VPETAPSRQSLEQLERRLAEAEETLRAIRAGEIDALVVQGAGGEQIYTLRSAEQPYRHLIEQMQEGAAILTSDGDVLYCNRSFAELLGVPLERAIGLPVSRFFTRTEQDVLAALLEAGEGKRRTKLLASDGHTVDVYLSLTRTSSHDVEQRHLIVADLSQLIDAQMNRERAEKESAAKDQFMAILAHELRNPLSAISAAAEILQSERSDRNTSSQAASVIARQSRQLSRLVDDLLDVARVITGKVTLSAQDIDLADIAQRCVLAFTQQSIDRTIELSAGSAWIRGDPARLEQIITNILANAIKYTSRGGAIRVAVLAEDQEVVLRVEDNGFGISGELLPHIFDAFVQGERTLDRAQGGLGLGLTLVRHLVSLHNGSVTVTSDGPNCGSSFVVRLPRIRPARALMEAERESPPKVAPQRILVIEDNRDARETLRMMLELAGHEVFAAAEGGSGLELLRSKRPRIALIDVGLPGIDGYDVARHYRSESTDPDVVLVALTGYGTAEARRRSHEAGFDHHLVKPVNASVLQELLAEISDKEVKLPRSQRAGSLPPAAPCRR